MRSRSKEGQPERIEVYAVVGNQPPWSRLEMQGRRPLSPFVGREQELATLRERLRQVEGGPRAGGGRDRRARRGQVTPVLRVRPWRPGAAVADPGDAGDRLRPGHPLSPDHRPAQELLPPRRPR